MQDLKGQVAWVTGAGTGIGEAAARARKLLVGKPPDDLCAERSRSAGVRARGSGVRGPSTRTKPCDTSDSRGLMVAGCAFVRPSALPRARSR